MSYNSNFESNNDLPSIVNNTNNMIGTSLSPQFNSFSNDFAQGASSNGSNFSSAYGMQHSSFGMSNSNNFSFTPSDSSTGLSQFVPELDIRALMRAKERNMNMNVNMNMNMNMMQNKMQSYKSLSQNIGMDQSNPNMASFPSSESLQVSSAMIDRHLKRSMADSKASDDEESSTGQHEAKRQKKSKRPSDMPRRALSAYNIFFSEQRELILKDIEEKESGKLESSKGLTRIDSADKPSVLNRTFFPTRAKRAHRKVHGKIGLVQLARTVSQRWKDLPEEKRKHYQDLAEEDRRRHKKVMADYQERKAAENILSMVTPGNQQLNGTLPTCNQVPTEQQIRDNLAHQYQQRILAEMLAARQQHPSQSNLQMSGNLQMSSNLQMSGFNNPMVNLTGCRAGNQNFVRQAEQNMLNNLNVRRNQQQANMWQQMGMGPM